jgi:hypothetical protein
VNEPLKSLIARGLRPVLAALLVAICGCGQPPTPETPVVQPRASAAAEIFPLRVVPGQRYLEDRLGRPFLMQGDTPWGLIVRLSREDAEMYLLDRRSRGFNTLLVRLIDHKFAVAPPANWYGDKPFHEAGNFATPNEAYFAHADWVLQRARELGFAVLLAPAYLGYGGGDQGWYKDLSRNSDRSLRNFGRYLGQRYQKLDNIIWTHGGDFNPPKKRTVQLIAEGIHAFMPQRPATAHCARGTSAADYWGNEPWLTLNSIYTGEPVFTASRRQSESHAALPFFLLEGIYENEHASTPQSIRTQAYHAVLSGAAGQVFGNNPLWHFDGPGLYPAPVSWKQALDGPGSRSMTNLWSLFSSLPWWALVPDTDNRLLVGGFGDAQERAVAALTNDGGLAVVYVPTVRDIQVELSKFGGPRVAVDWHDPGSGAITPASASPFPASGLRTFHPPDAGGGPDWVLVLRSTE